MHAGHGKRSISFQSTVWKKKNLGTRLYAREKEIGREVTMLLTPSTEVSCKVLV